ncbi:MAG: NAD(P)/FAD-dependent oxidoreductase, partial [Tateyamaria sp.]
MDFDTLVIGAGAAGMMCAAHTGGRVLIVDHAKAPGEKIRISGGGRCNFTNMHCDPAAFISENPHFAKSALARYTQWDFIDLVDRHAIPWHEKTLGQLFCDTSAKDIIAMLRGLMQSAGAELLLSTEVSALKQTAGGFSFELNGTRRLTARRVVIATGGKSIPKMGATGYAYDVAPQFGHRVTPTEPALVPFTFPDRRFADISGVACPARITANGTSFDEAMLFTHRGLSGPAILQVSSYWAAGDPITVHLAPDTELGTVL